jgi:hypothetical protein
MTGNTLFFIGFYQNLFQRTTISDPALSRFDTFICRHCRSKKYERHCRQQKNGERYCCFLYGKRRELIDMKINALDLLDNPKSYKVDVTGHKLIMKK